MLLLLGALPGSAGGAEGQGPAPYARARQEKVGEVAEIRYRALADAAVAVEGRDEALFRLALYQYMRGDYAGAEHDLRRLIRSAAGTALESEARLWLGRTHSARGEQSAALVELREGLRVLEEARTGDDALIGRYLYWLGDVLIRDGNPGGARDELERLFEGFPGHPLGVAALHRLREAYADLGATGEVERIDGLIAGIGPAAESTPVPGTPVRGGFAVQVASFSSVENARNLVGLLETMGWRARVREADLGTETRFRVRIGGLASREEARRIVEEVSGEGFDCTIVEE